MTGILTQLMKGMSAIPFRFTLRYLFDNLSKTGRTKKQVVSFAIDGLLVAFCIWAAFSLRIGQPYTNFSNIAYLMVVMPPITVLIFAGFGIYRWVVRASSNREFEQVLKGAIGSSSVLLALLYLFPVNSGPRSLFVIYGVLLILGTIGIRLVWAKIQNSDAEKNGKPVAVYGAGSAGRQLVSLMRLSTEYHPEFFLDDSYSLIGTTVAGLPVLSPSDAGIVTQKLKKFAVEEIIMAMPSIKGENYSRLLSSVAQFELPIKTTPPIKDIVSGKSSPDEIREIRLEDLLGRDPVAADAKLLRKNITGKRVMVTGAGGSIGSELCRQIHSLEPECLIILDNSEPSLYAIDQELNDPKNKQSSRHTVHTCLGSITDAVRIEQLFQKLRPDTVYHAAAYKHVPLVESNPFEGLKTNVVGTRNLVMAAERSGVSTFVMISTDKAVRPTNVMGATKRIAEQVVQGRAAVKGQKMTLCLVRFGNVLGSSGSVIPLFKKQIAKGGPLTVTHPDMTRYFMLIPEAVSLVIQAGSMARGGEVFLLEMGSPVKILELAKAMIRLHGMSVMDEVGEMEETAKKIEITFTGIRPGEKLYEELLIDDNSRGTDHPKIRQGSEQFVSADEFDSDYLGKIMTALNSNEETVLKDVFYDLVSGYNSTTTVSES